MIQCPDNDPLCPMDRVRDLLLRGRYIYRTDGVRMLLKRGVAFVAHCLFERRTCYLVLHRLENLIQVNESDLIPRADDFSLEIVASNDEADRLEARGLDFRSQVWGSRRRLDRGAVAVCVFIGDELAHIGWVALSKEACDSLGEPPVAVDFSGGEGCRGGVWTDPKFRRLGLHTYGNFKRLEFMLDKGLVVARGAVAKGNTVALRTNEKLGAEVCGEGRYRRILWWRSWKEKPLTPDSDREQSNAGD